MCDLRAGKVPNALILMGYTTGFIYVIYEKGASGIPEAVINMMIPILLFFVLFRIRALGAGDIKLFSAISLFLDQDQMLMIICLSFITGAVVGTARLIRKKLIMAHLKNFLNYIKKTVTERKVTYYRTIDRKVGELRFCGCIFAATLALYLREALINGIF